MFPVEKTKPVASSEPAQGNSKTISNTEANLGG
jgi:cytochrome c oxidase assembly protein subunit 11